jgi:hypothetical protein
MVVLPLRSCTWQKGRRVISSVAPLWDPRLTQIKFLAAWMRQGRLKTKQPWDVGMVYPSPPGERRRRHIPMPLSENIAIFDFELSEQDMQQISAMGSASGRLTDFGFAPKWD